MVRAIPNVPPIVTIIKRLQNNYKSHHFAALFANLAFLDIYCGVQITPSRRLINRQYPHEKNKQPHGVSP